MASNHTRRREHAQPRRGPNPVIERIVTEALDVGIFLLIAQVFNAAASDNTPFRPSEVCPLPLGRRQGYQLTDQPLNRALLAAFTKLKSLGIPEGRRMAYVWRVSDIGSVGERIDKLDGFVTSSAGEGMMIREALIKAFAVATYDVTRNLAEINLDSLLEHARRFAAQEHPDSTHASPPHSAEI